MKLTVGSSAATSKLEGRFRTHGGTSSDGTDKYSGWGVVNAISESLYTAATGTGTIHGFMSTMLFARTGGNNSTSPVDTGFTAIEWQSVQMQPTVLSISDISP